MNIKIFYKKKLELLVKWFFMLKLNKIMNCYSINMSFIHNFNNYALSEINVEFSRNIYIYKSRNLYI
ncbi:hypothetical protein COJ15_17945 [Bacillus thuringiensis]|uniref:Uncharacterized protein n=1 Tax=Bacillus thuringiensis TaxID=1428 RepID=A0A9X6ZSP0_BACTU|nr:hypothetical protein COJ15_17945 [Bacillus thuringiensis]